MREHATAAKRSAAALATVALLAWSDVADCINCPGHGYAGRVVEWLGKMNAKTLRSAARRFNVPLTSRMTKDEITDAIMSGRWGWNLKAPSLELGFDPTQGDIVVGHPGLAEAFSAMGQAGRSRWLKEMGRQPAGSFMRAASVRLRPFTGRLKPDPAKVAAALGFTDTADPNGHPSDVKALHDAGCFDAVPGVSATTQRVSAYDYMSADRLKAHRVRTNDDGEAISARYGLSLIHI